MVVRAGLSPASLLDRQASGMPPPAGVSFPDSRKAARAGLVRGLESAGDRRRRMRRVRRRGGGPALLKKGPVIGGGSQSREKRQSKSIRVTRGEENCLAHERNRAVRNEARPPGRVDSYSPPRRTANLQPSSSRAMSITRLRSSSVKGLIYLAIAAQKAQLCGPRSEVGRERQYSK